MLKAEELLSRETWTFVLSKLSTKDELSCRCVCVSFKKQVDSILNKNQDRLWLRRLNDDDFSHYFCYDKDHRISSRDTLYFYRTISLKNLEFVSALMPSLKIIQLDPYGEYYFEMGKAVPITKIFPQVACLILPGETEKDNFVGDLSQVKHLTLSDGIDKGLPTLPNLDSLEVRKYSNNYGIHLPMPSKRFVVPDASIGWRALPKTMEVIETELNCGGYISAGEPHFSNLKILKNHYARCYDQSELVNPLINFLKNHKESLTELSFSAEEEVNNLKVLMSLLTQLQRLSLEIKIDKQAIALKEMKTLAHNLQYFELSFYLWLGTEEKFSSILENLPIGLDNLSIKIENSDGEIIEKIILEKVIEKVVNGDTKTVSISGVYDENADFIIDEIVNMKPELLKVEKTNKRVIVEEDTDSTSLTHYERFICNIVISL